MIFKPKKSVSFKKRIIYLMITAILIVALAFVSLINFMGVFNELYFQSYRSLSNQVHTTANLWSDLTVGVTTSVEIFGSFLNEALIDLANAAGTEVSQLYKDEELFIEAQKISMNFLLPLFQNDVISGAFVVFNESVKDEEESRIHSTMYIRVPSHRDRHEVNHLSPEHRYYYTGHMYPYLNMRIGGEYFVEEGYMPFSPYWQEEASFVTEIGLDSEVSIKNIYEMLLEMIATEHFVRLGQLGYWTHVFEVFPYSEDAENAQLYIIPLIDENNVLYGAYGVEVSQSRISEIMVNYLTMDYKEGFYVFGRIEDDQLIHDVYVSNAPEIYNYISASKPATFTTSSLVEGEEKIQTILDVNGRDELFYVSFHGVNIYQPGTLHEEQNWALIGFSHESEILRTYRTSKFLAIASILISSGLSLGLVLLISSSTIKKITDLSTYIKNFEGDEPFSFSKTDVEEIDELVTAIDVLNNSVLESGRRVSKILDMTKMPIGFFEDKHKNSEVFITPKLLEILGIDPSKYKDSYMSKDDWDEIFFKILGGYDKTKKNIYKWEYEDNPLIFRWLKIESATLDNKNIGVIVDVTDDVLKQQKLEFELDYDSMTRLLNRHSFKRIAAEKVAEHPEKFGAMLFGDLDNLKYVNDTYGHETGDKYIIAAAEMFSVFKEIGGIIARISGDEFAVYIHGFESVEEGREEIYKYIESYGEKSIYLPDRGEMRVRASLGISWYGLDSKDTDRLIKYADYAMYEIKLENKGGVKEFNKETYDKNVYLLEKKEALNKLIDGKLIRYAFQPIVNLEDGSICGYEALMRSLTEEFKSPLEILSVAASESKLYQIEKLTISVVIDWVIENKHLLGSKKVFINTVSNQILNEQDFAEVMEKMLQVSDNVVYEVAEGGFAETQHLTEKAAIIREKAQSMLAIDDFGTGYSNELMILSVTPDIIKLDRGLVTGIFADKDKQQVVRNLITYCKKKGVKVVAEGVELEQELATLIKLGVDMAQGYYFGYPTFELQDELPEEQKNKILSIRGNLE